ncbi:hypothetical protein Daus18300_011729 [Diaporthe australafricana]|uniref:F-box domain-containing protein n=1 Tax=Diaporthe australafricana TaxID=127596 RepID=A0ABR3W5H5_9PEZI
MYNNQNHSIFFDIPGEVREIIYSFALTIRYSDFEFSSRPFFVFWGERNFSTPLPALMLTCKRAYVEMRARVHEEAVLRACMFEHGRRIGVAVRGTFRIPRLRRLVFHVAMEHANWNTWVKFFGHVLESAEGLKELVIDWEPRRSPMATRVGFMAQHEDRMEKRLFRAVAEAPHLESLRIHGHIPAHWVEELDQMLDGKVKVVCMRERWWLEDRESA